MRRRNGNRVLLLILVIITGFTFLACAGVTAAWILGGEISLGAGFQTGTDNTCADGDVPEILEWKPNTDR